MRIFVFWNLHTKDAGCFFGFLIDEISCGGCASWGVDGNCGLGKVGLDFFVRKKGSAPRQKCMTNSLQRDVDHAVPVTVGNGNAASYELEVLENYLSSDNRSLPRIEDWYIQCGP